MLIFTLERIGRGEHGTNLVPVIRINIRREHKTCHDRGKEENYNTTFKAADATRKFAQNGLAELVNLLQIWTA
jgi:hypothetical protein